jgi:uracil-DNA glycosylase family 4
MSTSESLFLLEQQITACRKCPRLVTWREEVAAKKRRAYQDWEYWGRPVPGFGDPDARLLVVGLAPGAHGSNRTGQMFTGDESGKFLFRALYENGFANQPETTRKEDGMELHDVFITAVCRCVPPGNHPTREEMSTCQPNLLAEISLLTHLKGIILLGKIAYDGTLAAMKMKGLTYPRVPFGHGVFIPGAADRPWMLCSYHPSAQNTQTGRLTRKMFAEIWKRAKESIEAENA